MSDDYVSPEGERISLDDDQGEEAGVSSRAERAQRHRYAIVVVVETIGQGDEHDTPEGHREAAWEIVSDNLGAADQGVVYVGDPCPLADVPAFLDGEFATESVELAVTTDIDDRTILTTVSPVRG